MNPVTSSITEEILAAHTKALDDLVECAQEPVIREGFRRLFRCLETWELELLTSQVGRGIELDTFSRLSGALASLQLVKNLLTDLVAEQATKPEVQEARGRRFTQSLLGSKSSPI